MVTYLAKIIFDHLDANRFPDVFRDMQPQYLTFNWAVIGHTVIFFLTLAGMAVMQMIKRWHEQRTVIDLEAGTAEQPPNNSTPMACLLYTSPSPRD